MAAFMRLDSLKVEHLSYKQKMVVQFDLGAPILTRSPDEWRSYRARCYGRTRRLGRRSSSSTLDARTIYCRAESRVQRAELTSTKAGPLRILLAALCTLLCH